MSAEVSPFPHDPDYVAALFAMAAARLDATNAEVLAHMRTCQTCLTQPFGSCPTVLGIIANPPKINPQNN